MANEKTNVMDQVSNAVKQFGDAAENAVHSIGDFFQGNPFDSEVGKKIGMF